MRGAARRPLAVALLVLILALALAACGGGRQSPPAGGGRPGEDRPGDSSGAPGAPPALPAEEKILTIFTWADYLPEDVVRAFEDEYGVRVQHDTFATAEEMLARLEDGGLGRFDLIVADDYLIEVMIAHGLLERLDHGRIPNLRHVGQRFLKPPFDPANEYSLPLLWGTTGIAYHQGLVPEPITSWADLWKPDLAGKIIMPDDSREVVGAALQMLGYSKNDTDTAHLREARDRLLELAPRVKAWVGDGAGSLLAAEEAWVAVVWTGDAVLALAENPSITYVLPREGGGLWQDHLAIPAEAPHPGWAHAFIDFLYRPDVSARVAEAVPLGTPNVEALELLPDHIRNNPAIYPDPAALERAEYLLDVGDAAERFERIFAEVKQAGER